MMSCEERLLRFTRNDNAVLALLLVSVLFLMFLLSTTLYAAEVQNIKPLQVGNRILFEFDVEGSAGEETDVSITLTINNKTYTSDKLHLEGDFGKTRAGKGKKIWWNVLQDFPRGLSSTFDYEINAGGKEFKDSLTGIEMVFVKGGCYKMGGDAYYAHEVCVGGFYIGKYEVTQGQWKAIMGNNPSYFSSCGDNCPVENVRWNDIQDFINKLNQKTGKNYKLPTEAEWEYAARSGGKNEKWAGTSSESELTDYAWYNKNSGSKTHPVGQKKPNGLGIYDMSGNVWEWVNDWFDSDYYKNSPQNSPQNNPKGPNSGSYRVLRGGKLARQCVGLGGVGPAQVRAYGTAQHPRFPFGRAC